MTVHRDLLALRALFSAASAWCKGYLGMDRDGQFAGPLGKDCSKRCIVGGMHFVAGSEPGTSNKRFLAMQAALGMDRGFLTFHNDSKGRLGVLALIDTALDRTQRLPDEVPHE